LSEADYFRNRDQSTARQLDNPRVALVHYWYMRRRGGERVLDVMADMFPSADIFTIFYSPEELSDSVKRHRISSSFLNRLPSVRRYYRMLMPFLPIALEQLSLKDYDLVISHEAGPAKGVLTRSDACHICYCHSPMRYLWDMYQEYLATAPFGPLGKAFYALSCHYMRGWDYASSTRVDHFAASSRNSARRIRKYYGRSAQVIYPPVDTGDFSIGDSTGDFYLVVSPLVQYKRIDLAIRACNQLRARLIIIGHGEQSPALRKLAGPTISFLGFQSDEVVRSHYRRCRALLFPGEEDIGLTPIEAQASGRPVIAYARGGALESVLGVFPGEVADSAARTGVFFEQQSVDSLVPAIRAFESMEHRFSPRFIRTHAQEFDATHFKRNFSEFVTAKWREFSSGLSRGSLSQSHESRSAKRNSVRSEGSDFHEHALSQPAIKERHPVVLSAARNSLADEDRREIEISDRNEG
jgi:glycosyltransferase involved in cell wall biosynthesis